MELDFAKVRIVAPPFLNVAIGNLLEDIKAQDFDRLFSAVNLDDLDDRTLAAVVSNCKRYYTDPVYRAARDEITARRAAGDYGR